MAEPGLVDNTGPGCGVRGAGCGVRGAGCGVRGAGVRGAGARERRGLWKTRGPGVCWVLPRKISKQQH